MSRRTTFGEMSQSAINARAGNAGQTKPPLKGRASIATATFSSNRRASTGGRASIAGLARRSTAMASTSTRTDPRNITDKRYVGTNVRTLIEFLTYHNYDHAISPKILNSPSGKDFNNIVQFLFRLVDQNLSCPGKFEDEVIQMFKYIRYPYAISKNGLSAVGSPHSWPQLLASLMWVIELLEYDEEVANHAEDDLGLQDDDMDAEEDAAVSEKAFFSYLRNAYVSFLGGDDDAYNDLTDEFTQTFQSKNANISAQTVLLQEQNAALQKEIAEVESRCKVLPQLQAKKRDYENDKGKFEHLISQLEKHQQACRAKIQAREAELEKTNAALASTEEAVVTLREKIAVQELSPEDVQRMSEEREHLQQSLLATSETSSALQKKVWDAELVLRDRVQSMEEAVRLFNSMAEDLDYAVDAAQGQGGSAKSPSKLSKRQLAKAIATVKINIDIRAKKRSELIQTDIRKDVIPPLHQLKTALSDVMVSLHGEIIALQDASEEEELRTVQVQEARLLLESKLRRAEEAYRKEKAALESLAGSHDREMDELESKLIALRDVSAAEVRQGSASRKVAELKSLKNANREGHRLKKKETIASIMQVVTAAANHREHTQMRLGQLTEMHRQRLEHLLQLGAGAGEERGLFASSFSSSSSKPRSCTGPVSHDMPPVPPTRQQQQEEQQEELSLGGSQCSDQQEELEGGDDEQEEWHEQEEGEQEEGEEEEVNESLFHDEDALGGGSGYMRQGGDSGDEEEEEEDNNMRFVSNLTAQFNMDDSCV